MEREDEKLRYWGDFRGFLLLFCFDFRFQKGYFTFCTASKHKKDTFEDYFYLHKNARMKLHLF